ncbi:MAG: dienelactone hydrolase family protein [Gammaproteobacteria bacterium]|nr:dienelactone hydrolase family protein [Gammaproteobacteria bacterium]MCP5200067.1 dienelactone hydrolase family protein [Gammaproteobacteria bacterium]
MGQRKLTAADGFTFGAYEAAPSGTPKGGVVVIQEIFGVNKHIRAVVDDYAKAGYVAIAPQIFDRVEADVELGYTEQADFDKGLRIAFQDLRLEDTLKDLQAAIDAVAAHGKVGVVGYCFGGLLTWLSACELDRVAAASAYYGGGIAKEAHRTPRCPVMMHFGEKDAHIPMSDVETIRKAQPDVQVFVYDADHGFNCNDRGSFEPTSAATARERTLAHFDKHLTSPDDFDKTVIMSQ